MAEIKKFLFDTSFDMDFGGGAPGFSDDAAMPKMRNGGQAGDYAPVPETEEAEPPPPPPEMFTVAQIEAAREEGYIGGHTAALDEASAATERMAAMALTEISQGIMRLRDDQLALQNQITADAVRLVRVITRKMMPATAEQGAAEEISALVADLIPQVMEQPRLSVRVHPDIAANVRDRLEGLVRDIGYEGKVSVMADHQMPPANGRIDWGDGGVERDTERQWQDIEAAIDAHLATLINGNGQPPSDGHAADNQGSPMMPPEATP
ncbi:MAG: flagellar assembly protein FliH [Rhodospirillaceae bacterium]